MKKIFYLLYAVLFKIYRLFPVKENRISLVSPHNSSFNDSLKFIKEEFENRGDFEFNFMSSAQLKSVKSLFGLFFKNAYLVATSRFVFLNDNFMPFANVTFAKETKVVQLWHGQGAFKKFGLDSNLKEEERALAKKCAEKYDYIAVSSENVKQIYMSAFGVGDEKIIVTGIPDSDYFYNSDSKNVFRKKCNIPSSKKIVLYAPTFRENMEDDVKITERFNIEEFAKELGEDYVLAVRLHPQVHTKKAFENAVDATDYPDVNEIIIDSDILITDYSSICMEFSMLDKPILFYAYDLEKYKMQRDFYFDYEEYVPGKICKSFEELVSSIKNNDFGKEKNENFKKFNFSFFDGKSSKRVVDFLLSVH